MPTAPKDFAENMTYRQSVLKLGRESQSARDEIKAAAARDPIWFIDTFLWTVNQKDFSGAPERLFVTYPWQEDCIDRMGRALGTHDLLFPKSRAMGGTWIILAFFLHRWMFRRMQSFLLLSAKEDRVDNKNDPDCLFWKLDYMLGCLPAWMAPAIERQDMKLFNLEMNSSFNGETTNKDAARGGRRGAILADEAAAMKNSGAVADSIQQVTNSCFWLSTPQGAWGAFYDLYAKYNRESPAWVIPLHWSIHPVYSQGLEYGVDGKPTSPWYRFQCQRMRGPKQIAQELDLDFLAAGGQFFEPDLIDRLLKTTVRSPAYIGELDFNYGDVASPVWQNAPAGRVKLWCPLGESRTPPKARYVIGCDVSTGKGGEMSSNSAASVVEEESGEKVGQFVHGRISPENFGRYSVALAKFFHGAKLIWGRQGPGGGFKKAVIDDCRYFHVFRQEGEHSVHRTRTKDVGYVEIGDNRTSLFTAYVDALSEGRFINRDKEAVEECRQFIYGPDGTPQHSKAIQRDMDPESKGRQHGDICVADCMANRLLPRRKVVSAEREPGLAFADPNAPIGSPAWQMQEYLREKREKDYY